MSTRILAVIAGALCAGVALAQGWTLPEDRQTLGRDGIAAILAAEDYPPTSGYSKRVQSIDFSAYGQDYTQVVVTLEPDRPRMHLGKKLVVVGAEPGSEYAGDFLETPEGGEGPGVWLARRGFTFIALTRVGRWNFLAPGGTGSWESVPLGERMPVFHRGQKAHWTRADYEVGSSGLKEATSGDSASYRIPKPGTALYRQMLALTPQTFLTGYRKAIEQVLPAAERGNAFVLYWGMSTGGAFLYPLAKQLPPDGYLGWGTSSTGMAYVYRRALQGDFRQPYAQSAMRLRERGLDDFTYYTKELDEATRLTWWQSALKGPRFKSGEDPMMQFGAAALTEIASRLWLADFLPPSYRAAGFGQFIMDMLEPSFPPQALKRIAVLDMGGTRDEAIPPATMDAHREVMAFYARKYRTARVQDFQHYLYRQQSIKVVGTLWLRFIESGYFDP
jgi:hypothetical protein